jgi:hypothetical protein
MGACAAAMVCACALLPVLGVPQAGANAPAARGAVGTTGLGAVACAGAKSCMAIGTSPTGAAVVVPISNGLPGGPRDVKGQNHLTNIQLSDVACASASFCVAVGTGTVPAPQPATPKTTAGVVVEIVNGIPGSPDIVLGPGLLYTADAVFLNGVACSTADTCLAVGWGTYEDGIMVPITEGSASDNFDIVPAQTLEGIACKGASGCWTVGQGLEVPTVFVPITDGAEQGAYTLGLGQVGGIGCGRSATCLAFGNDGSGNNEVEPITSDVAGSVQPVPGNTPINSVACRGTTYCLAVGSDASGEGVKLLVTDGVPGSATVVGGSSSLSGVSCPSSNRCFAVGRNSKNEGVVESLGAITSG